jgi:hypothetical protein
MLRKPKFATIDAPSFDGIDSQRMRARYAQKAECLWLELSPAIVDYLSLVAKLQMEDGAIHRPHASAMVDNPVIVDCKFVSFSYKRSQFRVTTPKATKYFPINATGPSDAELLAKAFLNNAANTMMP